MTFPVLSANGPSGYNLTRSLRFRSSASAYLSRSVTASSRTTWTWSAWVKKAVIGTGNQKELFASYVNGTNFSHLYFDTTDTLNYLDYVSGVVITNRTSTAVYRDPSAWYHIVLTYDTTNATAQNRVRLYVNGVEITSFSGNTSPAQNYASAYINSTNTHTIGVQNSIYYFDGYLAEVNFIDGQALTPSSFGSTNSTTGVWQPAAYTGTYGTNGFYLPFTDNSALTTASNAGLGKDFSGNANYWVTNNISITTGVTYDSMTDVPTLTSATAANYCVWNPLSAKTTTLTDGNLAGSTTSGMVAGTIGVSSGKWYWECTPTDTTNQQVFGIISALNTSFPNYPGGSADSYGYYGTSGNKYNNASSTAYGATFGNGDVIGVALDLDAGTLTFYKNNTSQGVAFSSLSGTFLPAAGDGATNAWVGNFGQRPFSYTPPSGFVALNTYNLPASTVPNGAAFMAATLYTGTLLSNTIANTVGSASFQPDLVWIKSRSAATDNKLTDSVRGVTKGLISNTTGAETTDVTGLTAFNSNGFTVSTDTNYNNLAATYVAWNWKGGGTAVSNTNGSITSSVSANTTSGCSVVTYTGVGGSGTTTVGHGLGVSPSMVIIKRRNSTANWATYHTGLTSTSYYLFLNSTDGQANYGSTFISPSSSTLTIDAGSSLLNTSTGTYVAYCFAAIKGFSAFGSYTGNGSTDGPFVYLGFRPRYLMLKVSSTAGYDWLVYDSSRDTYNVTQNNLRADTSDAESTQTANYLDFLSNGFKIRGSSGGSINPSQTIIYAAFAESPFQNSLAR